ncbi:MAG TPA: nucleotidyl transferase AbiEii/AbiGii toxin family protein [Candidatus Bathyarchaeia archaeon]|nr:nucleotidyl transferase AbiEii/AbiGii toxin family protein [Candidatus Bathyarchaeia archaeon]
MKRKYDLNALARACGFNIREMEKVCRISDLLEDFSAAKFLFDRLSLYGGTALTFIYSPQILRLSIDLDLNYRHLNVKDWGKVRNEIDKRIKDILYRQEYKKSNIAINSSYPLTRFTIKYTNTLSNQDSFKIEIGYMRRTSILKTDAIADFKHIGTQETFKVRTPIKEELFANKWCVLLYRKTPRDLFDTYQITKMEFNHNTFRKCALIDSLTRKKPKLYEINPEFISKIPIDSSLRNLLQTEKLSELDFNSMITQVTEFTKKQLTNLTSNEIKAIDQFFDQKNFRPDLIDETGVLHEKIKEYPAILRALQEG